MFTQAKRLEQVSATVADAVSTMLEDVASEDVEVDVQPVLIGAGNHRVVRARQASQQAVEAQASASTATRRAVVDLRRDGLTVRDIAFVLGLSHQRVSQLEKS